MIISDIRKHRAHGHNNRNGDRAFYQTPEWRNTRNAFISLHSRCVQCGNKAQVADHKIRVADGGAKLDWNNLQAMCHKCHNKKDNNAGKRNDHL